MLRESIQAAGTAINLDGLADANCTEIEGIPHSTVILEFANAFMTRDPGKLALARDNLEREMNTEALIDAIAVAANFQRMVRIADATGIPSDPDMMEMQAEFVKPLGLDKYVSAGNSLKDA